MRNVYKSECTGLIYRYAPDRDFHLHQLEITTWPFPGAIVLIGPVL